jgi:hypothetical protein
MSSSRFWARVFAPTCQVYRRAHRVAARRRGGRSMASNEDARAAREAKLDELHEKLTGAVESLVSGDDWRQALAFAARFRSRSFNNTMLIWVQHEAAFEAGRVPEPFPTLVAGYRQWQGLGRQVMKGQPGYMIFAPVTGRFATATPADAGSWRRLGPREKPKAGEVVRSRMVGARPAYVWDASQTDGEPLPSSARSDAAGRRSTLGAVGRAGRADSRRGVRGAAGAARGDDLRRERHDRLRGAHGRGAGEHGPCCAGQDARARAGACADARSRRRGSTAASRHPRGRSRVRRADDRCRARHGHRRVHDPVRLDLGRPRGRPRARPGGAGHRRAGAEDRAGDPRPARHAPGRRRHPARTRTRHSQSAHLPRTAANSVETDRPRAASAPVLAGRGL